MLMCARSPDALEKEAEAGGKLDTYEVEGPDRAELLQDLAEFQLAAVRCCPCLNKLSCCMRPGCRPLDERAGEAWLQSHA